MAYEIVYLDECNEISPEYWNTYSPEHLTNRKVCSPPAATYVTSFIGCYEKRWITKKFEDDWYVKGKFNGTMCVDLCFRLGKQYAVLASDAADYNGRR